MKYLLIIIAVGGFISFAVIGPDVIVNKAVQGKEQIATSADRRVIERFADGSARLSLEYGIALDESALREMMQGWDLDLSFWNSLGITVTDWSYSPQRNADSLKQHLLDNGESPQEFIQSVSNRVEAWKREGGHSIP